jgi:hypothetical protein
MAKSRKGPPRLSEPAPNVRRVTRREPGSVNTGPRPKADPLKSMALGGLILVVLVLFFLVPFGGKTTFSRLVGSDDAAPASAAPASGAPASAPR